jgi:hypothetical protein
VQHVRPAQHLADGLKESAKAALLRDLTSVVRALVEGQAPVLLAPFVAGASLAARDKYKAVSSKCGPSQQARSSGAL